MSKIHLYFRSPPKRDRFLPGDRYLIPIIRSLVKDRKISGVEKVFINLCKGFNELKVDYDINLPFKKIKPGEPVIVLGNGKHALDGYDKNNPIIAGIGLMTHPTEWLDLFQQYPVTKYLQHSAWARNVYVPYYGSEKCDIWPAGIDTGMWSPDNALIKKYDVLLYNKIRWNNDQVDNELRLPIINKLNRLGISYYEIVYGQYKEADYFKLLQQSRCMLFLCEHESEGFACCEALSMNIPVLAWDQGYCLDPNRFVWNDPVIPATSVPFFDQRCGTRFKDIKSFEDVITPFWNKVKAGDFTPREYILENLTLKRSAERMLDIIDSVYK